MHLQRQKKYLKLKYIDQNTLPITYKIEDLLKEEIEEIFYKEQLQKIDLPVTFIIDKYHRRRTRKGKKQALVSWNG